MINNHRNVHIEYNSFRVFRHGQRRNIPEKVVMELNERKIKFFQNGLIGEPISILRKMMDLQISPCRKKTEK